MSTDRPTSRPPSRPPADFTITREVTGNRGRYAIALGTAGGRESSEGAGSGGSGSGGAGSGGSGSGGEIAQLTYAIAAPDLVIADHTGVPPAFRGSGAALALVERLVADARAEGVKIVPLCSYIDAQRRKHPDWADVFTSR